MQDKVRFLATIDYTKTDRDGETRLVLLVPASDIGAVTALNFYRGECVVQVTIEAEPKEMP